MTKFFLPCVIIISLVIPYLQAQDVCPPSFNPPGGVAVQNAPMFVAFGYDDNNYGDGMNWVLDCMKGKNNPSGNGNPATFDGTPILASFFMKGKVESDEQVQDVLDSWKRAYDEGHEIGNHTFQHVAVDAENELRRCDSVLQSIGIPKDEIVGFRTPQLAIVPSMFDAVYDRGFLYDCTVEHHNGENGGQFVWPYTLENGHHSSAFGGLQTSYPGMWEFPVHQFTNGMTGFDYNAWTSGMSGSGYYNLLVEALEHRLSTNRCPFLIGVHSDYYATTNTYFEGLTSSNVNERRKAIEDFVNYALTKPDVRIVPYHAVLLWMRYPVGLGETPIGLHDNIQQQARPLSIGTIAANRIELSIQHAGIYSLYLYSVSGRKLRTLGDRYFTEGAHSVQWNKNSLTSGTYLIRLKSTHGNVIKRTFILHK